MTSEPGKTTFLLTTTGSTEGDRRFLQLGWGDQRLTERGSKRVRRNGGRLLNYCRQTGIELGSAVWAVSPLPRTVDTFHALVQGLEEAGLSGIDPTTAQLRDELKGIGAGRYTGWPLGRMLEHDEQTSQLFSDFLYAYPSGPGMPGECLNDVSTRLWNCLEVHYLHPGTDTVALVVDEEIARILLAVAKFGRLDNRAMGREQIQTRGAVSLHLDITHGSHEVRVIRHSI